MPVFFILSIFIGIVIRILLIGNTGFIADVSFWKSWSLAAVDHGVVWTAYNTNINYPPGFIYVLWFMGKLYAFIGGPFDYNAFWRENNFAFLFASKFVGILADVVLAGVMYWFLSQKEKLNKLGANLKNLQVSIFNFKLSLPALLTSIFFLNPVVIMDSAQWGQVEAYGLLFTITAMILLFYKKPMLATAIFTVGTLMKLQNIIFIPLYFIFVFRYFGFKNTVKALGIAVFTFFLVTLPFLLQGKMERVLHLMTVNNDYFPWLSLNAHNLWWIVAKTEGMKISDKITVLGILNAKTVGLMIFSSCYLLACLLLLIKTSARNFILSLIIAIYGFFLFMTESHERYSYPVVVLLLLLYPFVKDSLFQGKSKISKQLKRIGLTTNRFFWTLYFFFAVTVFINIHTGLILNYPENGLGFLTRITTPQLTIANSYFSIFLFFPLLVYVVSEISPFYILISIFFLISALIGLQANYFLKGKVSLTYFKPIIKSQSYGTLQVDRSVNSFSGWKSWSRLSNNYFYYRFGFGTHTNSKLVFDINRKFSKLITDFGINTEAGTDASVIFKIFGDGKELFSSEQMGKFDFPGHIEVDVKDIKYLGLEVNDAGNGISEDHADWYNPILYK